MMAPSLQSSVFANVAWLVVAATCLNGCSSREPEWPPQAGWVTEHFTDHKPRFLMLRDKLAVSKYHKVYLFGNEGAYGAFKTNDKIDEEMIQTDASDWAALLRATRMTIIEQFDDETLFLTGIDPFVMENYWGGGQESVFGSLSVSHSSTINYDLLPCGDEVPSSSTGRCAVHLDEDWYILYSWVDNPDAP